MAEFVCSCGRPITGAEREKQGMHVTARCEVCREKSGPPVSAAHAAVVSACSVEITRTIDVMTAWGIPTADVQRLLMDRIVTLQAGKPGPERGDLVAALRRVHRVISRTLRQAEVNQHRFERSTRAAGNNQPQGSECHGTASR